MWCVFLWEVGPGTEILGGLSWRTVWDGLWMSVLSAVLVLSGDDPKWFENGIMHANA